MADQKCIRILAKVITFIALILLIISAISRFFMFDLDVIGYIVSIYLM